jgi:hypothetical protein
LKAGEWERNELRMMGQEVGEWKEWGVYPHVSGRVVK